MVHMQVGRTLIGIRPDSEATGDRLRALFAPYVTEPNARVRSNFSLRAPRSWARRAGELYVAGEVALRSRHLDHLFHAMASHIAGAVWMPEDFVQVRARVLHRGDRAVMVEAPWSAPIVPRRRGIEELMLWDPQVDPSVGAVGKPPELTGLRWEAASVRAPAARPKRFELVGIVLPPAAGGRPDVARLWLRSRGPLDTWGLRLNELDMQDRVVSAANARGVRRHVLTLLA